MNLINVKMGSFVRKEDDGGGGLLLFGRRISY